MPHEVSEMLRRHERPVIVEEGSPSYVLQANYTNAGSGVVFGLQVRAERAIDEGVRLGCKISERYPSPLAGRLIRLSRHFSSLNLRFTAATSNASGSNFPPAHAN